MVNDAANQVSDILATHGWSPAELDRPADIPLARARVDLAYRQQVEADIAISALRAADAVTRASDDLANHFDRLIEAMNPKRRPFIISFNADALPDNKDVQIQSPWPAPTILERAFIVPGAPAGAAAATSGTIEVRIRNLLTIDFSVFGNATDPPRDLSGFIQMPVELPKQVQCQALAVGAATGVWHLILIVAGAGYG